MLISVKVGGKKVNLVDELFKINFEVTMKCLENEEEEPTVKQEHSKKLSCIIANEENPVNNLLQGLQIGLEG